MWKRLRDLKPFSCYFLIGYFSRFLNRALRCEQKPYPVKDKVLNLQQEVKKKKNYVIPVMLEISRAHICYYKLSQQRINCVSQ